MKAINARWHPEREYGEATVDSSDKMKLIVPARRLLINLTGQYLEETVSSKIN